MADATSRHEPGVPGPGAPSRLLLAVVPLKPPRDEAQFKIPPAATHVYHLAPDARPWEVVHDVLGARTGLRTLTREVRRPRPGTEVTAEARLEHWASTRDPADVAATGTHHRRIVRTDGVTTVDTRCALRSTATAFHVTIDLQVAVDGVPHHQRQWVRTFLRMLLSRRHRAPTRRGSTTMVSPAS